MGWTSYMTDLAMNNMFNDIRPSHILNQTGQKKYWRRLSALCIPNFPVKVCLT